MYDIVGKRNLWFAISAILTIPGLIFIFLGGLQAVDRLHRRHRVGGPLRERAIGRRGRGCACRARVRGRGRHRAARWVPSDPNRADRPRSASHRGAGAVRIGRAERQRQRRSLAERCSLEQPGSVRQPRRVGQSGTQRQPGPDRKRVSVAIGIGRCVAVLLARAVSARRHRRHGVRRRAGVARGAVRGG